MATVSNNQVGRTAGVATDKSELEIWLDISALKGIIEQYNDLKNITNSWVEQANTSVNYLRSNTDGYASMSFESAGKTYCWYAYTMTDKVLKAISIMEKVCSSATDLLFRCENFYEILLGGDAYISSAAPATAGISTVISVGSSVTSALSPICSILYLDETYYRNNTISANTSNAMVTFHNLKGENEDLKKIIDSLSFEDILIDREYNEINKDCLRADRLDKLEKSFIEYVKGVQALNDDAKQDFPVVYENMERYIFDNTRTYEYPNISETDKAILQRAIRNELHEMGLSDEAIDNALKRGFTLEELAEMSESIIVEDKYYANGGLEMKLFDTFLSGKATTEFYDKYADKLDDGEVTCWKCVALYLFGTVSLENLAKNGENPNGDEDGLMEILTGDEDELMKQINAILASKKKIKIMQCLNFGGMKIALDSGKCAALTPEDCETYSFKYREYKKNMILNDMLTFLSCKMEDDEVVRKGTDYKIDSMTYSKATGLTFYIDSEHDFSISSHYICGPDEINNAYVKGVFNSEISDAQRKQAELLKKCLKDDVVAAGTILGTYVGHPGEGGELARLAFDVVDGLYNQDTSADVVKKHIDFGALKALGNTSDSGNNKTIYNNTTPLIMSTYNYLTYTGVEDALQEKNDFMRVKLTGSAGECTINYYDDIHTNKDDKGAGGIKYCTTHDGIVAPEYVKAFSSMAVPQGDVPVKSGVSSVLSVNSNIDKLPDGGGLSAVGNWNPEFTEKVMDVIDHPSDYGIEISEPDRCKEIVNGGFDITGLSGSQFEALDNTLDQIQNAYTTAKSDAVIIEGNYAPKVYATPDGEIRALWGAQLSN
jgi:hypothetical protein